METNKLLTLEEIEEMQAGIDSLRETYINVTESMQSIPKMDTLLATARAYLELKKKEDKCHVCGEDLMIDVACLRCDADEDTDDKPHLPTLKVIVEAMKEAQGIHTETARSPEDIGRAIKSLEKHLE